MSYEPTTPTEQTREEKIEAVKEKMRKLDEELEKLKRGEDE